MRNEHDKRALHHDMFAQNAGNAIMAALYRSIASTPGNLLQIWVYLLREDRVTRTADIMLQRAWQSGQRKSLKIQPTSEEDYVSKLDARHRRMHEKARQMVDGKNLGAGSMKTLNQLLKSENAEVKEDAVTGILTTTKPRVLEYDDERQAFELGPCLQDAYSRQKGHRMFRKGMTDGQMARHVTSQVNRTGGSAGACCDISGWDASLLRLWTTCDGQAFSYGALALEDRLVEKLFCPRTVSLVNKWRLNQEGCRNRRTGVEVRNEGTRHSGKQFNSYLNDAIAIHVLGCCIELVTGIPPTSDQMFIFVNSDDWIFSYRGINSRDVAQIKLAVQAAGLASDMRLMPLEGSRCSLDFCSVKFSGGEIYPCVERLGKLFFTTRPGREEELQKAKAQSFLHQWGHIPFWSAVAQGMLNEAAGARTRPSHYQEVRHRAIARVISFDELVGELAASRARSTHHIQDCHWEKMANDMNLSQPQLRTLHSLAERDWRKAVTEYVRLRQ